MNNFIFENKTNVYFGNGGVKEHLGSMPSHGDKPLLQEPPFARLGKKYGKSAPQIILRWHIQSGNIVIPGSKNTEHIKSNFDLFDFVLTDEEMA